MSLLDELSAELCAASDHLPLSTLRHAVSDLRSANDKLLHAVRQANAGNVEHPTDRPLTAGAHATLARLGSATTHLEAGAGLLMRAQDEVGTYLATIGAHVPATATPDPIESAAQPDTWWSARVGTLTAESGPGCDDPARTVADLMARVVAAVRATDRAALHAQLVGAGAGLGSSLAGHAATALRRLATDTLRRTPVASDLSHFQARSIGVRDLLPRLPEGVVSSALSRLCHDARGAHHDAVDVAVGSAVLVAVLAGSVSSEAALDA